MDEGTDAPMDAAAVAEKKIQPLADRVVILPLEAETKQMYGSLHIPDVAQEKPHQGKIVAAGQGRYTERGGLVPMELNVGDKVLYGKYSGTEVTVEGVEYLIIKEADVFAIVE